MPEVQVDIFETWRPIPGFEGYEISNYGSLRSRRKDGIGRYIRTYVRGGSNGAAYLQATIRRKGERKVCSLYVHRIVWEAFNGPIDSGMIVDHINGNRFDARLENLRIASLAENGQNRFAKCDGRKFKGVCREGNKWRARIKNRSLGTFDALEDAARAYDVAARKEYGNFAKLNFPDADCEIF